MPEPGVQLHVDDVSQRLGAWLQQAAPDATVAFVARYSDPDAGETAPGSSPHIEVCFRSISSEKPDRAMRNRDDAFLVNYALRVTGGDALASQRIFSRIFFAAYDSDEFSIQSRPGASDPSESALPGPATLSLTARLVRPEEAAAPGVVLYPLDVRLRSLGRVTGRVITESGAPVMLARVDAQALDRHTVSGPDGRFTLYGAPAAGTVSLVVTARDRSVRVSVDVEKETELVIKIPKEKQHA